jgi:hypothetical protein
MNGTTATLIALGLIALVFISFFAVFRSKGKGKIKGPFGMGIEVEGSNDTNLKRGDQMQGATALALYEKRRPIYDATEKFLIRIVQNGKATPEEILHFGRDVDQALFLFGPDLDTYLRGVYSKAVELGSCIEELKTAQNYSRDEWLRLNNRKTELFQQLAGELEGMRGQFAKYMTLKDD